VSSRITTKADLRRQVLSTLWKDQDDPDFSGEVDGWIAMCEQKIAGELRVRQMVVRATDEIDDRYLTLPTDWLEAIRLRIANVGPLLSIQQEDAAWYSTGASSPAYAFATTTGGLPRHYSIVGDQLEILPDPTPLIHLPTYSPMLLEMAYYGRPAALIADADSNSVLVDFPAIYLYGTLAVSAPHVDHDERLQTWGSLYGDAVTGANLAWERAQLSGSRRNARIRVA